LALDALRLVGKNPYVFPQLPRESAAGTGTAFPQSMIKIRKRMPKGTPGDALPKGVLGRREVVYQLTGQQRFAPGVYHDRRALHDRRRPVWRQVVMGNVRCLQRSRGRRREDRIQVKASGPSLWFTVALVVLLALGLRLAANFR
jgi:hypothetical protein